MRYLLVAVLGIAVFFLNISCENSTVKIPRRLKAGIRETEPMYRTFCFEEFENMAVGVEVSEVMGHRWILEHDDPNIKKLILWLSQFKNDEVVDSEHDPTGITDVPIYRVKFHFKDHSVAEFGVIKYSNSADKDLETGISEFESFLLKEGERGLLSRGLGKSENLKPVVDSSIQKIRQ